jgi:hypothetical protein
VSSHDDETGGRCTRHQPVSQEAVLTYAAIGSRMSSFHHDVASKLQGLMMAIDEITELGNDDTRAAATTAATALQELNQLLAINRALTKAPQRKRTALRELMARASERHGVKLRGDMIDADVNVALPSMTHALDLLVDMLAGPLRGERTVALEVSRKAERVVLVLTATTTFEANNEHIALAHFLLARETGTLACRADGFVVELPL